MSDDQPGEGLSETDEWTFVSRSNRRRERCGGGGGGNRCGGGGNAAAAASSSADRRRRHLERGRAAAASLYGGDGTDSENGGDCDNPEMLRDRILSVMGALEGPGAGPFLSNLVDAICAGGDDPVREIVCYGIGRFARHGVRGEGLVSSSAPGAPLLQVACALLLRSRLTTLASSALLDANADDNRDVGDCASACGASSVDAARWKKEQSVIPMVYFEPLLVPVERQVLEESFCVKVLETNERGRRRVSGPGRPTLFFMPHCPMRLYSNVLWANWDKYLLTGGNVRIYGNSFLAYDTRTMDPKKRRDPSNGVFCVLPFVQELPVPWKTKKKRGKMATAQDALLVNIEVAFNDCTVTTFGSEKGPWPPRPDYEPLPGTADDNEGEVL